MKRNEQKITKEVTETIITFIASDGKEFKNEEDEAYMLIPRNIEDVCAVNRILDYCDGIYGAIGQTSGRLTQDDIGKTILINFGYEGMESGWYTMLRKDEYLKRISDELNKYETEIANQEQ